MSLFSQLFKQPSKKAHAKVLVKCPNCEQESYILAGVTERLEVIDPPLKQQCKLCKKEVKLIRQ